MVRLDDLRSTYQRELTRILNAAIEVDAAMDDETLRLHYASGFLQLAQYRDLQVVMSRRRPRTEGEGGASSPLTR